MNISMLYIRFNHNSKLYTWFSFITSRLILNLFSKDWFITNYKISFCPFKLSSNFFFEGFNKRERTIPGKKFINDPVKNIQHEFIHFL